MGRRFRWTEGNTVSDASFVGGVEYDRARVEAKAKRWSVLPRNSREKGWADCQKRRRRHFPIYLADFIAW